MTTKTTETKRVRMRALTELFLGDNEQRIVREGEVFDYVGVTLPNKATAEIVPDDTPLGWSPPAAVPPGTALPWTTRGFVELNLRNSSVKGLL